MNDELSEDEKKNVAEFNTLKVAFLTQIMVLRPHPANAMAALSASLGVLLHASAMGNKDSIERALTQDGPMLSSVRMAVQQKEERAKSGKQDAPNQPPASEPKVGW